MKLHDLPNIELDDLDLPDDAIVLGAFIIMEVQHMDAEHPHVYFTSNRELTLSTELGLLTTVTDRKRDQVRRGWGDD